MSDAPPRISGTRHVTIADPLFGDFKLLYPTPRDGDPWGVLAPIQETEWGWRIPVVSAVLLSHAMHGDTKSLREKLGRPPRIAAQRMCHTWCLLGQNGSCAMAAESCRPGTGSLPQCYLAPDLDPEQAWVASAVALAWDEGRYVIVVEGEGFVL